MTSRPHWILVAGWIAVGLLGGCGKSPSSAEKKAPEKASGAGNPLTAPVDYLGAVGAAQKQAAKTIDLTSLQQAVQAFQAGEERLPRNLGELVSEGYLPRLPAPPKGMQWAYQPQLGQVRAVPAPQPPLPTAPAPSR